MKKSLLSLIAIAGFAALAGCSTPSVITLNDGRELQTLDKPKFDDDSGFYEFKQLDGKPTRINKDQVRTIKDL
ncbi:YgdI/YgdR family lipoprotein [Pseudomonas sp. K1(2024)]|uniref:YgdI/YgdR family lipoprotein n=2 Tax=Pseudomonas TaxID=286 RepID=A0AAI8KB92_9PSED|nr:MULTISPECIES: YgdI/YgdR family lipoprotein [Pseudomonas]AIZ33967.1 lipoprotein [Pseudomonas parafulva]AXO89674.1 YgdI/YgdR family lipoprotein [Pseudomonas parafulva]MBJ9975752.1 YgdI/YgdR family lipoprotein [Pseudomonas sp. S30]MBK0154710.1 YgdI/YgdR family lipoprotein [Pseudomonas sp. S75]MDO7903108.1 YgdI/YgdR family lipoprotein [Pseudomonas sp. K13]